MNLEITCNGNSEIVICPEDTLFLGVSYQNVNVFRVFGTDESDEKSIEVIEKELADHSILRLFCYKSGSEPRTPILDSYRGMKYLEFAHPSFDLTVTIV